MTKTPRGKLKHQFDLQAMKPLTSTGHIKGILSVVETRSLSAAQYCTVQYCAVLTKYLSLKKDSELHLPLGRRISELHSDPHGQLTKYPPPSSKTAQ